MLLRLLITLSLSVLTMPVHAVVFCNDLKNVLGDSPQSFVNLRGNFDFSLDHYLGNQPLAEMTECQTYSMGGMAEYSCSLTIPIDDAKHVHDVFETLAVRLKHCVGGSAKEQKASKASRVNWRMQPTDETVSLRYQRIESKYRPPRYVLILSVTAMDMAAE